MAKRNRNGCGMYLFLQSSSEFWVLSPLPRPAHIFYYHLSAGWKTWVKSLEERPLWPQLPLCIYLVLDLGTEAPQGVNDLRAGRKQCSECRQWVVSQGRVQSKAKWSAWDTAVFNSMVREATHDVQPSYKLRTKVTILKAPGKDQCLWCLWWEMWGALKPMHKTVRKDFHRGNNRVTRQSRGPEFHTETCASCNVGCRLWIQLYKRHNTIFSS